MVTRLPKGCLVVAVILGLGMGCNTDPDDEETPCLQDAQCAENEHCVVGGLFSPGACEPICFELNELPEGTAGALCEFDNDCDSGACDNDVDGAASCTCTPAGNGGAGGTGGAGGSSGTGGTGGTPDPCMIQLPQPASGSGLNVDVYAKFNTRPAGISFATDGTLYVGTDVPEPTSPVLWVHPGGTAISESTTLFADPDAVVVDVKGLIAAEMENVLIGGSPDGGQTGQLMEMTGAGQPGEGQQVGQPLLDACLRNINHLIFDKDDRLLVTNFNNRNANVCAINGGVTDLIPDVEGDGPAGITVQDLGTGGTGDLFVTTENEVYRYNSDGSMPAFYANGSALAYGPEGSPFEGLLIRHSGMLLVRSNVESDLEKPLLTGSIGASVAFDADANLYISDPPNSRVLRVSLQDLDPTDVGCP